jgi:putative flippase GtrA
MTKAILYINFAVLATIVNLCSQEITSRVVQNKYELFASIFIGTLAGLLVKYLLDKKYIFNFTSSHLKKDLTTFFLYSLMGVATTIVFWLTEYTFDVWFETKLMRYVGATLGLSIGYIAKYYLDKKYVFIER